MTPRGRISEGDHSFCDVLCSESEKELHMLCNTKVHCLSLCLIQNPTIRNTLRFQLITSEGIEEFRHSLPSGGHLVWVLPNVEDDHPGDPQPYTVTLFHQLKCLDILRQHDHSSIPAFSDIAQII